MRKILLLLSVIQLTGCGLVATFNLRDAYLAETISPTAFYEVLPFQEVNGLIIISAKINEVEKQFIFDTGAATILDDNFAEELETDGIGKIKTFDSNGAKRKVDYVTLEKIQLNTITLSNVVASISDFDEMSISNCIDISGIIGANVMNKCIWQIDYKKQKIIVTNSHEKLKIPEKATKINFSAVGKGVPNVSLFIGGVYCGDAIFDTGSNGRIEVNKRYLDPKVDFIEFPVFVHGIHSAAIINQKIARIPTMSLNKSFFIENEPIIFEGNRPFALIGNRFLNNFKVTFDWMDHVIFMEEYDSVSPPKFMSFGFTPRLESNRVVVSSIIPNSSIHLTGLQVGDEIIEINGIEFEKNTQENFCNFLEKRKEWEELTVLIKRDNETLTLNAKKVNLIEDLK